jgi:hypothetical protein
MPRGSIFVERNFALFFFLAVMRAASNQLTRATAERRSRPDKASRSASRTAF